MRLSVDVVPNGRIKRACAHDLKSCAWTQSSKVSPACVFPWRRGWGRGNSAHARLADLGRGDQDTECLIRVGSDISQPTDAVVQQPSRLNQQAYGYERLLSAWERSAGKSPNNSKPIPGCDSPKQDPWRADYYRPPARRSPKDGYWHIVELGLGSIGNLLPEGAGSLHSVHLPTGYRFLDVGGLVGLSDIARVTLSRVLAMLFAI